MKRKSLFTRITLMAVLLMAMTSQAQEANGTLTGRVLHYNTEKGIPGILISYRYENEIVTKDAVKTNEKGLFTIPNLTPNRIVLLFINDPSYEQKMIRNIAEMGNNAPVTITLKDRATAEAEYRSQLELRQFTLEYKRAEDIYELIEPFLIPEKSKVSQRLNAITVMASPDNMEEIESIILEQDSPPKQVWVEVLLIEASNKETAKGGTSEEIKPVVDKLKGLFKYKTYTVIGRAEGMGMENSSLQFGTPDGSDSATLFRVQSGIVLTGQVVQLQQLGIEVVKPLHNQIKTSINIKNGETLILGASRNDAADNALITVVKAKIL